MDALEYLSNQHHSCHWDIKPENILVSDEENMILSDFRTLKIN